MIILLNNYFKRNNMCISKSLLSFVLVGCLVGCGGGGSSSSTPASVASSTPSSAAIISSSSSSSLISSSSKSSVSSASGLAFCASLSTDPDGDGIGVENNQTCQMRNGFDITRDMGVGWNLGNTMDATGASDPIKDETNWGNPKTTKANLDALKQAGFNTLRLPISWDDHISGTGYTINTAWLDRVEEIANYALDNGMYVIINIHHNNGWEAPTIANEANSKDHLIKIWPQIAERFKKYDHHVIFETMNEPRVTVNGTDDWTGKDEYFTVLNRLNAAALDAIRWTGGNNAKRLVMLPGYAAGASDLQLSGIVLPADKMIALSTHAYSPYSFALDQSGTDKFTDTKSLDDMFLSINNKFILKGVPVIMGEWAATNKNNLAERVKHAEYYVKGAKKYGIPTVWWDNGNFSTPVIPYVDKAPSDIMGLLDRNTNTWKFPTIVDAIMRGAQ